MKNIYICISLLFISIILTYSLGAFYAYFYPLKFSDEVIEYSLKFNVDPALVASVINVESGYNENAISSKGAKGLMQIIPSTGKWLSEKINEEYDEELLLNATFNIKLGSYYLSYLIERFEDEKVAICAYNAGQGNVKEWLKNEKYSKDGKILIEIPFEETKNYINKIEKNYRYYKNRYSKLASNN